MGQLDAMAVKSLLLLSGDDGGREDESSLHRQLGGNRHMRQQCLVELESRGWVSWMKKGTSDGAVQLTEAGRRELLQLELPALARFSGGLMNGYLRFLRRHLVREARLPSLSVEPTNGMSVVGENGSELPLKEAVAEMGVEVIENGAASQPDTVPDGGWTFEEFKERLLELHQRLDTEGSFQGMVPIHQLRDRMGGSLPRDQFDRWLIRLDTERVISLDKITNTRETSESQRAGSLQHPYRGLLFYVSRRGHYVRQ
ncbi:MAG: hypothetical protein RL885_30175 [Planctomycetota bacterium]